MIIIQVQTTIKMPNPFKEKARELRRKGYSYNKISAQLGVSKSTMHYWFTDLPRSPFQSDPAARRIHLSKIRLLASKVLRDKRIIRLKSIEAKVSKEIKHFSSQDKLTQKAIASFLYWAEGTKTRPGRFQFANTDPALSLLFITLMRNAFDIEEKNIRIALFLHYYHNVAKVRLFWSKLLNVPEKQFEKIYIKSRKKTKRKRKNFAGICFIKYGKGGENLRQEMLYYAKSIQEIISPMRP